ncbi:MAG: flagellar hook-basal body complex protein FliE [Acetivibrionales bacterium]|jgi:flagellar hook-basal body complex protein FliE|nr:flagellar hook-basal body complex protein FliE [Clostridiaceae bacterium]
MAIQSINLINNKVLTEAPSKAVNGASDNINFKDLLLDALNNVNTLERESDKMTEDFIAGRTDDIHSVLIAAEKASVSLQFITEVRNKVMEAYQEIMRMQI